MDLEFNEHGLLPVGEHILTLEGVAQSVLINGPPGRPGWDQAWRQTLLDNFSVLVRQLWQCDIERIYIFGSFVEAKDRPGDIDGFFECHPLDLFRTGTLQPRLNELDPHHSWRILEDRDADGKPIRPMKTAYHADFMARSYIGFDDWLEHWQKQKHTSLSKGIVRIVKSTE